MENNHLKTDVLVVGGGLAGVATALALQLQGKNVTLLEPKLPQRQSTMLYSGWDERIYAISPANQAFLQDLGAWPTNGGRTQDVIQMSVYGDEGGMIEFKASEMNVDRLTVIIESRYLLAAIWARLEETGVNIISDVRGRSIQTDPLKAILTLEDERQIEAQLIIGADGANSWVRNELGIDIKISAYEQYGVVANFECEKDHKGVAYQWFDQGDVLAYLPLPNKKISMVWSTADPQELMGLNDDDLAKRVAKQGRHTLGELTTITPASSFELRLIRPKSTIHERVVLVGDAAHTIHPLAGQGINLGFGDAMALSKMLDNQDDIGHSRLLRRYALRRTEPVRLMQLGCDGLFKLFNNQSVPAISWIRNKGLGLVNKSDMVKRKLIKQAMGL